MRPYRKKTSTTKKSSLTKILAGIFLLLILTIIVVAIIFIRFEPETFSYVYETTDGEAIIRQVDSTNNQIYDIKLSAQEKIELSHSLGEYQIKNAWILGRKEGLDGELLAKTIQKNYHLPIYLYKSIVSDNLNTTQNAIVFLINRGIVRMDMQKYDKDVGEDLPYFVKLKFVYPTWTDKKTKVEVIDSSGSSKILADISSIIQLMGGKIVNNVKSEPQDLDCLVSGSDDKSVIELAKVFSCTTALNNTAEIDVRLKIGKKFVEKF